MKNLPWILTAILALAVINLYFKVYNLTGPSKSASMTASDGSATLRLAYVNADSILENFTQFRKEKDVLDKNRWI